MANNRNLSDLAKSVTAREDRNKLLIKGIAVAVIVLVVALVGFNFGKIFDTRDYENYDYTVTGPVTITVITDEDVDIYDNYDDGEVSISYYSDGDDYIVTRSGSDFTVMGGGKKPLFEDSSNNGVNIFIGADVVVERIDIISPGDLYVSDVVLGTLTYLGNGEVSIYDSSIDELDVETSYEGKDKYPTMYISYSKIGSCSISSNIEFSIYGTYIGNADITLSCQDGYNYIHATRIGESLKLNAIGTVNLELSGEEEEYEGKLDIDADRYYVEYGSTEPSVLSDFEYYEIEEVGEDGEEIDVADLSLVAGEE